MRPFTAPISERNRQKYGEYQPRYETESSMRAFTAPISNYKREKYGEYEPRYVEKPSMRPFDADISERSRELYGDFQPRYETDPSMSAFDSELGSYKRDLFGDYRPRHSKRKVGQGLGSWDDANGVNWVDATLPSTWMSPQIFDEAIYRVYFKMFGGWVGLAWYRILIDGQKVYPFINEAQISSGTTVNLGTLSSALRTGETCVVQFRSDNAADTGPAQFMNTTLDIATFE